MRNTGQFRLNETQIHKGTLFILYSVKYKNYLFGFDPTKVKSYHPIKMEIDEIFNVFNIEKPSKENIGEIEEKFDTNIEFFEVVLLEGNFKSNDIFLST